MALDLERIRAVCFDVDGTLSDTDNVWVARLERTLHSLRFFFPGRQTNPLARRLVMEMETPGNLAYGLLDRLHLDDEAGRLIGLISRRRKDPRGHFLLVPGVREMLACIQPRFPLAVVSARGEPSTLAFLDQYELRPFFRAVATALTCAHTKPFPDPLLWAADQLGVPAGQCLMVGDTTMDIRTGRAAGAQTVGVLCGFGTRGELERAGADLILESTADLAGVLNG